MPAPQVLSARTYEKELSAADEDRKIHPSSHPSILEIQSGAKEGLQL